MFTPFHAGDRKSNIKVSAGLSSLRKLHVPLASGGLPRLQPHASTPASGHRPPPPLSAAPRRLQSPHLATTAVPAGPKHQPHLWTSSCVLLATGRLAHARYGSRHCDTAVPRADIPTPELKAQRGQVTPSQQEGAALPTSSPQRRLPHPHPPPELPRASVRVSVCYPSLHQSPPEAGAKAT